MVLQGRLPNSIMGSYRQAQLVVATDRWKRTACERAAEGAGPGAGAYAMAELIITA